MFYCFVLCTVGVCMCTVGVCMCTVGVCMCTVGVCMCTVLLPPGVNQIVFNKYIVS
jgi:hypothetical protein